MYIWLLIITNFFALVHTYQVLSNYICQLLMFNKFIYVLLGNPHNHKIEYHFGYICGIRGSNRYLDISTILYFQKAFFKAHLSLL